MPATVVGMRTKKTRKIKTPGLTVNTVTLSQEDTVSGTGDFGYQSLVFTLNAGVSVRHEILEGRNYTVVPMVMLTEGVHAGSNGPLYYPADELKKTPVVWNHKPIVVYHPMKDGNPTSACSPAVISARKVGLIMNARFVEGKKGQVGKLAAEAWLETSRLAIVDNRVSDAIKKKEMVEVSTGLFTDNELVEGTFGKETYSAIARNHRPDHLAILPDEKGACSIADGAGLLRNSAMSHSETREKLSGLVRGKLTLPTGIKNEYASMRDVFDTFCVFECGYNPTRTFKHDFERDEHGNISLKGSPVEVTGRQTYSMKDGTVLNTSSTGDAVMKRKEVIDQLIANAGWEEGDRNFLAGLAEPRFDRIAMNGGFSKADSGQDYIASGSDDDDQESAASQIAPKKGGSSASKTMNKKKKMTEEPADDEAETCNSAAQPVAKVKEPTTEEYVQNAPPAVRDMLMRGIRADNARRAQLTTVITANKANKFSPEALKAMPFEQLEHIAALAASSAPAKEPASVFDYSALGDAGGGPVANAGGEDTEEPLELPTLNFSKKNKGKAAEDDEE